MPKTKAEKMAEWRTKNPEKHKAIYLRYQEKNREKINAAMREQYKKNPEYTKATARKTHLRNKFGLTPEQYIEMRESQDNKCSICSIAFEDKKYSDAIDHCHKTGKLRAILCKGCNTGLGMFKDNPEVMRLAALYIEKHRDSTA